MLQPNRWEFAPSCDAPEAIAVIGMGCRFPGADTPEALWELLRDGRESITEVPSNRYLDLGELLDPRTGEPRKIATCRGGFLENVDQFDPYLFNISPREARSIDPQQRLLLETAWVSLEDAGLDLRRLAGSRTGVYVGIWSGDYEARMIRSTRNVDLWMSTGGSRHAASGRISFAFDLQGPSLTIDTACSSSLVAVLLACQALRAGACELSLVGGANVILQSSTTIAYTAAGALSPEGRCKFGDASADGFVRSEGAGMLVLKPMSKAIADGDRILAVIRGGAVNNNGRSGGTMMAPGEEAQVALLRAACADARIVPAAIDYVEAHGTGTLVGDPQELKAIGRVLAEGRHDGAAPCLIGSIKTNIGHTESASGVAGLIKAILCLRHREIPPSLHFHRPNPKVPWSTLPLKIVTERTPLRPASDRALASVNSFGITGTFANVIVEEAPEIASVAGAARGARGRSGEAYVLPVSARSEEALRELGDAFARRIETEDDAPTDLCYSAALRRTHHDWRMAVVGREPAELAGGLRAFAAGEASPRAFGGRPPEDRPPVVAAVFSGQGPQWSGMGRELMATEPVFAGAMERLGILIRAEAGWSLLDEVAAEGAASRLDRTEVAQPAIFAIQVALVALLRSWGVEPAAVVGHSVGEAAAAHVAGVLDLEDAVRVVCRRARIMQRAAGLGRMAAVELTEAEGRSLVAPYGDRLSMAAINGPRSLTLSGEAEALNEVGAVVEARGLFFRMLDVDYAFHSAQLDPFLDEMEAAVASIRVRSPERPLYSTVRGDLAQGGDYGPSYWPRNLRDTVRFADAIERMAGAGCNVFVEVGPHPVLGYSVKQALEGRVEAPLVLGTLRTNGDGQVDLRTTLAALYARGLDPNWAGLYPSGGRYVSMPGHPWHRESYWVDESAGGASGGRRRRRDDRLSHPLLMRYLHPAGGEAHYWETDLGASSFPWLADHCVASRPVFPAAAYILAALAAGEEAFGVAELGESEFTEAMFIDDGGIQTFQLSIRGVPASASFEAFSIAANAGGWRKHAGGVVIARPEPEAPVRFDLDAARATATRSISADDHYGAMQAARLEYGPSFRGVERIWVGEGEAIARLTSPPPPVAEQADYGIHPAILDACFQASMALLPKREGTPSMWLPRSMQGARLLGWPEPGASLWARVAASGDAPTDSSFTADAFLMCDDGRVLVEVRGLRLHRVDHVGSDVDEMMFEVAWRPQPLPEAPGTGAGAFPPSPEELAPILEAAAGDGGSRGRADVVRSDFDRLSGLFVQEGLSGLGFSFSMGRRFETDELMAELGVVPRHRSLFSRLLGMLAEDGVLRRDDERRWRVVGSPVPGDAASAWETMIAEYPEYRADLQLFRRCGAHLAEVLGGRIDSLELLFSGGATEFLEAIYERSPVLGAANLRVRGAVEEIVRRLPAGRPLRILELGAGLGGLTGRLLPALPAARTRYVFTDVGHFFLNRARRRYQGFPFVEYGLLDIEKDPAGQGYEAHGFDLVLAANVLHATRSLRETLANVRRLLVPGGTMVLIEEGQPQRWLDLIFGLTDGWWRFEDTDLRPEAALLSAPRWHTLLLESGFASAVTVCDEAGADTSTVVVGREPARDGAADGSSSDSEGRWLIFVDRGGLADRLAEALRQRSQACALVGVGDDPRTLEDHEGIIRDFLAVGPAPARGVLDLRALDVAVGEESTAEELEDTLHRSVERVLGLTRAMAGLEGIEPPRIMLVTRGSQPTGSGYGRLAPAQTTAWSTVRVAGREHPELRPLLYDLDADADSPGEDVESLLADLLHGDDEGEVALRGGRRLVRRLVRNGAGSSARLALPPGGDFQVVVGRSGSLEAIEARPVRPRPPGPGEVQIRVRATGVNFRDLLIALGAVDADLRRYEEGLVEGLGLTDVQLLGCECSGVVSSVGEGVVGFEVGDEVMAAALGTLAAYVTAPAALVVPKPAAMSHEQAASLPVAYLTAIHGLREVGGLRRGDRVLIHSAAGGVGIAAIHVALAAGAEVFGTAGSPRKRDFVRSLGVEHVFDSRSLDFADRILEITGGRGVDLALNSLADEFITRTFSVLAEGGRFVEIGKRGTWSREEVARRRPDVHYEIVDLARSIVEAPGTLQPTLRRLHEELTSGVLPVLPIRGFPIEESVDAFRFMQQARQIGKLVISQSAWVPGHPADAPDAFSGGTWLITGGFGGIGRSLARWLAERGASGLVLAGRRLPAGEVAEEIESLRRMGVRVMTSACDVSREHEVHKLLDEMREVLPPLRGVFHLAGHLDDGAILRQDWARHATVYGPKVLGAWNLHRLTRHMPLDCFVLYSSWASVVGSPGQANHSSANSFMDALAWQRRAMGLPALSINWGAWTEVGAAVRHDVGAALARKGIGSFSPAQGHEALARLLGSGSRQVVVSPLDAARWRESAGSAAAARLMELLVEVDGPIPGPSEPRTAETVALRASLLAAEGGASRRRIMEVRLRDHLARVLRLPVGRVDARRPFKEMGLDSLTALELRNNLDRDTSLKLPATLLWNYPTISALAEELGERMGLSLNDDLEGDGGPADRHVGGRGNIPGSSGSGARPSADSEAELRELLDELEKLPADEARRLIEGRSAGGIP